MAINDVEHCEHTEIHAELVEAARVILRSSLRSSGIRRASVSFLPSLKMRSASATLRSFST